MAAHQAPLSLGFSRQEHWSGLPFPSPMHESEKWKWSHSLVSDSSRSHGLQPTRLLCPWDSLGKSTGVGCHCLLRLIRGEGVKLCSWKLAKIILKGCIDNIYLEDSGLLSIRAARNTLYSEEIWIGYWCNDNEISVIFQHCSRGYIEWDTLSSRRPYWPSEGTQLI